MWNSKTSRLISPNGGQLVDLMVGTEVKDELKAFATRLRSLPISERSLCDLELLSTGAF